MKETSIGGMKVVLYDDIEQMPIERFHKYNKLLLVDSGIGSDLSAFDAHIEKAIRFMASDPKSAQQELRNMRQCVWFIQERMSPRYMAFAALVKSIDGKECEDLSDDALKGIADKLGKATRGEVEAALSAAKKKNR